MKTVILLVLSLAVLSSARPQDKTPAIVQQDNEMQPDGSYKYSFETANGIKTEAMGAVNNPGSADEAMNVQGSYSYVDPEGKSHTINYEASKDGFQAQGADIPQPPPVPEAIRKALEYNAAHPEEDKN